MYGIAVDIGATYTRVAIGDYSGTLLIKTLFETPKEGNEYSLAKEIYRHASTLIARLGIRREEIRGIGIGSIGPLNLREGAIVNTPNLPFKYIPLVQPLKKMFGIPTIILNDCSTAVVGEKHFGAGRGRDNLVYVTISTGIGGGAYVDGHLLIGKDGNAVEIGHMTVDPAGKIVCGCGRRGHWEAYSSGTGIPKLVKAYAERIENDWKESTLYRMVSGDINRVAARDVYEAAKNNDNFSVAIVWEAEKFNAIGFANIINIYDPSLITVGGSVALNNVEFVVSPLKELVKEYAINRVPEIIPTPLGEDAVLKGALALALNLEEVKKPRD